MVSTFYIIYIWYLPSIYTIHSIDSNPSPLNPKSCPPQIPYKAQPHSRDGPPHRGSGRSPGPVVAPVTLMMTGGETIVGTPGLGGALALRGLGLRATATGTAGNTMRRLHLVRITPWTGCRGS